ARYNETEPDEWDVRNTLLRDVLGKIGDGSSIRPRFTCDYGYNIQIGRNTHVNCDCVFFDGGPIHIGDDVEIGPMVQLYTTSHPVERRSAVTGRTLARPIRIGDRVWIGGGAIILPGISI